MELGIFRREHLQSGNPRLIGEATVEQFQKTHGAMDAWAEVEHNSESGKHTNVTADSLTVTGQIAAGSLKSPINIGMVPGQAVDLAGPVLGPDTVNDYNTPPGVTVTADVTKPVLTTDRDFLPSLDDAFNLGIDAAGALKRRWKGLVLSATMRAKDVWAGNRFWEQNRAQALGYWTPVAFSAANYSADPPLVWTVASGNQFRYAYTLIGKTMIFAVIESGGVVSGGPTAAGLGLRITIPGGFLPAANATVIGAGVNSTGGVQIQAAAVAGRSYIQVLALPTTAGWPLGAADTYFTITFEVQ